MEFQMAMVGRTGTMLSAFMLQGSNLPRDGLRAPYTNNYEFSQKQCCLSLAA